MPGVLALEAVYQLVEFIRTVVTPAPIFSIKMKKVRSIDHYRLKDSRDNALKYTPEAELAANSSVPTARANKWAAYSHTPVTQRRLRMSPEKEARVGDIQVLVTCTHQVLYYD